MPKQAAKKKDEKAKKPRLKRAPGAPRRMKSAFMFFSESRHKEIREKSHDKKILASDVAKVVSKEWKELPNEDRAPWEAQAALDRERYYREKAAYKGPWKIPKTKDPNAPKKPMSAFLAYSNERRKTVAESNPGMGNAEISRVLAKLWRECPKEIKDRYRQKEAEDRAKFKEAIAEWEQARYASSDRSTEDSEADAKEALPQTHESQNPLHAAMAATVQQANFPAHFGGHQDAFAQFLMMQGMDTTGQQSLSLHTNQGSSFAGMASSEHADMLAPPSLNQFLALPPIAVPGAAQPPPVSVPSASSLPQYGGTSLLPGSSLPSTNASLLHDHSVVATNGGRILLDGFQQDFANPAGLMPPFQTLSQPSPMYAHQALDPFIETDTGGYLAAFAALESGTGMDPRANQSSDQSKDDR